MGLLETMQEQISNLESQMAGFASYKVDILKEVDDRLDSLSVSINDLKARLAKLETPAPIPVPDPIPLPTPTPIPSGMLMGVNLHWAKRWGRERVFSNPLMNTASWARCMAANATSPWDVAGPLPPLDSKGYPTGTLPLADGSTIRAELFCDNGQKYPVGTYKVSFEGNAIIQIRHMGAAVATVTASAQFTIAQTDKLGIQLVVLKNDPANPLKNLKMALPGTTTNLLEPKFVNFMKPFKIVRFMDFMETNNSINADKVLLDYVTNHPQFGVPMNKMLEVVKELGVLPWVCLPHLSSDAWNLEMAKALKASNAPKIYVEYSNELWNGGFAQTTWLKSKASDPNNFATVQQVAAVEIARRYKIWEGVFADQRDRLKLVLAGQNVNSGVAQNLGNLVAAQGVKFDVISSAPYWEVMSDVKATTFTVPAVLASSLIYLNTRTIPGMKTHIAMAKTFSTQFGKKVEYVAYECGQHLRPDTAPNAEATTSYYDAQKTPEMTQMYKDFKAAALAAGADGICFFNSCQNDRSTGCWGFIQDTDQDLATAIKYQAVLESL